MSADLIPRASIDELCEYRRKAIACYAEVAQMLLEAREWHRKAVVGQSYCQHPDVAPLRYLDLAGGEREAQRYTADATKRLDQDMWRGIINMTPLGGLMDAQERQEFEASITDAPAPATAENIESTLRQKALDAGTMFRRGLVNAFKSLSRDFKSHDGFKIGGRVIVSSHKRRDVVKDVERVFYVLDGKPYPTDYSAGIYGKIEADRNSTMQAEGDYFRVRWFGNGNMHLWFTRPDLVEKANKLIAEHFGAAVGAGYDARKGSR